jgi:amylosucrase
MRQWVWTTFNSYQWDLNYANPAVFRAMAEEMLFLANVGVEVLRLDAVAFIWKRLGTDCENQPEAHQIIRAFNLVARIAAPSLLFKSEAIVHPDEVIRYIAPEECQLSYNPMLMALLWESLATRQVLLLEHALVRRHRIPGGCQWANYLRCHDDIGWTFDDDDARRVGIDPQGHRQFLNDFYTGQFPGSFARGVPFQLNPDTGDLRISGTLASLAGLEEALERNEPELIDMALRRITLLRGVVLSIGGLPLLYLGDEWGFLNDYSYALDPAKAADSRWVHRQRAKWDVVQQWLEPERSERRLFSELVHLIRVRKQLPAFAGAETEVVPSGNPHILAFVRHGGGQRVVVLANFADSPQTVAGNVLRLYGPGYAFSDHVRSTNLEVSAREPLKLSPYELFWLEARGNGRRLPGQRSPS